MAKVEVPMPKMGESITEGTVIVWHKKEGDRVELDETLLEIGTDKVDTDVPASASGVVGKILVPEGETVPVGHVIALIHTDGEESDREPVPVPLESKPAASPKNGTQETQVVMPKMGESITEGTVVVWHKKVGDAVEIDELLLEIGTDKVDTDIPSPASGILRAILVPEGETVDVGTKIAIIGADGSEPVSPVVEVSGRETPTEPVATTAETHKPEGARHLKDGRFLSPLVRSIAEAENVSRDELAGIHGSGHDGRITKKDLIHHLSSRADTPVPKPGKKIAPTLPKTVNPLSGQEVDRRSDRVEIIRMDRMRQLIAEHMTKSRRTSAHVTSFSEIDVTRLVRVREANKKTFFERDGVKLTYVPFLIHAAVEALRDYPLLNSSVEGDDILVRKDHHIGIAVALKESGLIVPVIRNAGRLSITGLAHAASGLAHRAYASELLPDDLQGGTFTLTNVGSLGSLMGTPIILQPQVAILATGTITKRPVVIEDPEHGDMIGIRPQMILSLSYDHRIIDGAMGIAFLRRFQEVIENLDPDLEL